MLIHATEREMQFIEDELLSHRESGDVLDVVVVPENEDELELSSGFEASTLLHVAAKYGNVEATRYLVDNGYDVDTPNLSNRTALMIAIHHVQIETMKILSAANAKMCLCDKSGGWHEAACALDGFLASPILKKIQAIFRPDSEALAKHLLERNSPLSAAVYLGNTSAVSYMLDNGRAVDERDSPETGRTALHYAVFLESLDMVNLLLDRGIDVNVPDASGMPALFCYNTKSEDTDEKIEMLKTMLNRGASLTMPVDDISSIHLFCVRGKRRTVRTILEYNNDLIASGKNGVSDLHFLMYNKNEGIIDELKNLDTNWFDQVKAAIIATCEGCAEKLEFLLKRGVMEKVLAERVSLLKHLSQWPLLNANGVATGLKCLHILLRYGEDVQHVSDEEQTIFGNVLGSGNFYLAKDLVAHLVLKEELGETIKLIILTSIDSDVRLKKYFGQCKGWLGKMKRTQIYNSTTLFQFLTADEKKICTYARDPRVVSQLERIRHNQRRSNMYYCNLLRRRINVVLKYAQLKKQVALVVPKNCQLRYNDYLIEMIANFIGV